ncbi:MAG: amidohydrolase family protein [Bauldia sp.]
MPESSDLIDVHHHFLTPRYVAARERLGIRTGPGFEGALDWTVESSLAAMDRAGIAKAVLSFTSNWTPFDAAEARDLARDANEFAARLVADRPGRFAFFAALPMPQVDAALAEIAHAMDELGAVGVSTTTNYGDRWPGDPAFDPVFAELDRRRAIVFVHPQAPLAAQRLTPPVPDGTVEFMFDIMRCITAMLFRGTFARFPNIRFIFTHGGGGLPALVERIARNAALQPAVAEAMPEGAAAILRRLYFDITTSTNAAAFAGLRAFVPPGRLLFGTDFPFVPPAATLWGLDVATGHEPELRQLIRRGNAEALFGQG